MAAVTLTFSKKKSVSYQEIVLGLLASALTAAALFAAVIPAFPSVGGSWIIYALIGALYAALFYVLQLTRFYRWLLPAVSVGTLLIYAIRFRAARNGMMLLANDFLSFLTGRTGRVHFLYETTGPDGSILMPYLYVFLAAIVIAAVIRRQRGAAVVLLAALCLPGWISGFFKNNPVSLILFALAVAVSLFPSRTDVSRKRGPGKTAFSVLIPLAVSLAAALLICLFGRMLLGSDFFSTEQAQLNLARRTHISRYEGSAASNPATGKRLLPEGILYDLPAIAPDGNEAEDEPVLEISMSSPGKLYLRGFTADYYEGSVWSSVDEDTFVRNAPLFYTLHENDFYAQTMISRAAGSVSQVADSVGTDAASVGTGAASVGIVSVQNIAACPYYRYLPYGLADASFLDERMIGDAGCVSEGKHSPESASYSAVTGSLPEWYAIELALAENSSAPSVRDYLKLEQAYYDYVLENDLQLSDDAAEACAAVFGEAPVDRRLKEILELVRNTLDETCAYDETVGFEGGRRSDGRDLVADFLTGSRRGYDIHYASAATAMLRFLGVPARYVEGYFLPADEAENYSSDEPVTLTTGHAHAWTEIYMRGIGWLPFETTPGYIDNEDLSLVSNLSRKADDSLGEGSLFSQAEILYTSGIHQNKPLIDPADLPKLGAGFLAKFLLASLLLILLVAAVLFLIQILKRRRRYLNAMASMKNVGTNEAVALQFGYASMLMKKAGIETMPDLDKMQKLNEEALFSSHPLPEDCVSTAEAFSSSVIEECRKKWSRAEAFRNHFIRWIV